MRSENRFRHGAGLEQAEAEQDGVADNAPNRVDGITGNRYRLYQHSVDTYNAYPLSKVWNFYTRSWS